VNAATLRGRCPLPTHGSKDSENSFTVNTSKNVWSCMAASCIARPGETVIVAKGFFDCMKAHQAGIPNPAALMGNALYAQQHELLLRFKDIVPFLDGDEPGVEATKELGAKLMYSHFVRAISLCQGFQPDQLSSDDLVQLFV
jgi:DNA primase